MESAGPRASRAVSRVLDSGEATTTALPLLLPLSSSSSSLFSPPSSPISLFAHPPSLSSCPRELACSLPLELRARRTAARRRCCWRRRRFRFHDFFLSHRRSFLLLLFLRVVRAPARPLLRYRPGPRPSSKLRLPQTAAPRSRRRGRGGWRRPGSSRGTATKFDYLPFLRVCRRRGRGGSSRGRARQSLGAGPRARGGLFPRRGLWSTVLRRLLPGRRGRGKG